MSECKKKPCGCEDSGLTTPTPCIHDAPECLDTCCAETFDSGCIIYNGLGNECLDIIPGTKVETVLDTLMTGLASLKCVNCVSTVIPANGAIDLSLTPTLQWGAVSGATSYDVWLGPSGAVVQVAFSQVGTSYTVTTPLIVGTTYEWYVVPRSTTAAATGCAHYTFTTVGSVCANPITVLLNAVRKQVETYEIGYGVALENILTSGFMMNSCDTCCPDCDQTGRYFLGNITQWVSYSNAVYNANTCPPPCCVNKVLNLTNLTTFILNNAVIGTPPGGCCDSFSTCFIQLANYTGIAGEIIEESSFKDISGLCSIIDWFQAQTEPFNVTDAQEILLAIVELGIVIQCLPDGTIITSGVDSYKTWYTATGQTCYSQIQ